MNQHKTETTIEQMMVACLDGIWMVGGLDQRGLFHRLNDDEEISQEVAEAIIRLKDQRDSNSVLPFLDNYGQVKDWVNEKIAEIFYPEG